MNVTYAILSLQTTHTLGGISYGLVRILETHKHGEADVTKQKLSSHR